MTLKDDLIAAKALIDTPAKWTKGAYNIDGRLCALGACEEIGYHHWRYLETPKALSAALPERLPDGWERGDASAVAAYNDLPTTRHADIMALFDRAIEAAS